MDWRLRTWLLTVCLWRLCQADDISDLLSPAASLSLGQGPLWAVGTLQSLEPKYTVVCLRLLSQSLRTFGDNLKHYLFVNEPWAHLRLFFQVCAIQIFSLLLLCCISVELPNVWLSVVLYSCQNEWGFCVGTTCFNHRHWNGTSSAGKGQDCSWT